MKLKILIVFILFSIIFAFSGDRVFAHPGNVSYDGCHFCRTNCGYWGFTYGTRHNRANPYNTCSCDPSLGPRDPLYCSTSSNNSIDEIPTPEPTSNLTPEESPTPSPEVLASNQQDYSWIWWVVIIGFFISLGYFSNKSDGNNY